MEIIYAPEFAKRYQDLHISIQKKAERRGKIFHQSPFNPSLKTEKLEPKDKEYWNFRIDKDYRILFRFSSGGEMIFLTRGHHNWIYRYVLTHQ